MTKRDIEPWEPEETVGKIWHALASRLDAPNTHDAARVTLSQVGGRLAVLFRGLGGNPATDIKAVAEEKSLHRLSLLRSLGTDAERTPRTSFDGESLRLPESIALFPAREANAALYLWLTACAAHADTAMIPDTTDPMQADIAALAAADHMVRTTLLHAPGFAGLYQALCAATLAMRPRPNLPRAESLVEARIRHALDDDTPPPDLPTKTPRRYKPFRPVALWPDLRHIRFSAETQVESRATDGTKTHRAKRRRADQADRNDSLTLHKFEAILSWAEFINLNRRVEDDDDDSAKKAADDTDEISLGQLSKAPATRLKLHLDLSPEDVDREAPIFTYPEWECRSGTYLPAHTRVLASKAQTTDPAPFQDNPRAQARIRAVKRQFESLRPSRISTAGHLDGDALDTDRAVRALVDFRATGQSEDRIWRQTRPQARDLAVSILLDVSRSTESAVPGHGHDGRTVIGVEREALAALAWGLHACGDDFAVHAFSSLKRNRVFVQECKDFAEPMNDTITRRIAALTPGHYTRLGAAIRHVSKGLETQARKRRLLLVITDGKPNDLDHYEGRHGIEDSRMAICEARRTGQSVFGITVDRDGKAWFPRMFGPGGFAVISDPDKLIHALPEIYRQLVGA